MAGVSELIADDIPAPINPPETRQLTKNQVRSGVEKLCDVLDNHELFTAFRQALTNTVGNTPVHLLGTPRSFPKKDVQVQKLAEETCHSSGMACSPPYLAPINSRCYRSPKVGIYI
jgi:hypothetical protein